MAEKMTTECDGYRILHAVPFLKRRARSGLTLKKVGEQAARLMGREGPFSPTYIWQLEGWDHKIATELAEALEIVVPE